MIYLDIIKEKLTSLLSMWLLIMLVAIWSVVIQEGHINRDGLLYLKQAYLIAEGSWKQGLALYPWSFFSILIATFHKITNLHLLVAAHAIDLGLFGIAVLFYLKTLKLIYKEKQIIFYGGLTLLSFVPIMDDYIGMVLRDHGLWAGCMLGTYFYFKNIKEYSLKNSIAWQFGFLFAGLFRPEGLVFLIFLPLWNLYQNRSQRFKQLTHDCSLSILLTILSLFAILLLNFDLISIVSSSRLPEFFNRPAQFFNQLTMPLPIQADNKYLSVLLENYSLIITYAVLLSVLIFKWINGLGVFHGGLFFCSFFLKKKLTNNFQKHIYLFLIVSFILVSINLFNFYVLTNRYWGIHWWWMFILITPYFKNIFELKLFNKKYIQLIILIAILLNLLSILIDRSKDTEMHLAKFLIQNEIKNIDFGNNHRIKFYYNNHDISKIINIELSNEFKYKIKKCNNFTINSSNKNIVKIFSEKKPQYCLIKL
jgi:hypothetical protein